MAGGTGGSAWKALKKFGKKATGQQIAGCCVADVIDDITKKWTGGGGGGLPPSEIVGGVLRGDGDGNFEEVNAKDGIGYTKAGVIHKIDEKYLPEDKLFYIDATGSIDPSSCVTTNHTGLEVAEAIQNGKIAVVVKDGIPYFYNETITGGPYDLMKFVTEPYVSDDECRRSIITMYKSGSNKVFVGNSEDMIDIDCVFEVNFTENSTDNFLSDKNTIEINGAYLDHKIVRGVLIDGDDRYLFHLTNCEMPNINDAHINFVGVKDGVIRVVSSIASSTRNKWVATNYDLSATGGEKFVVTVEPSASSSWMSSTSGKLIYEAFKAGKEIVCKVKGQDGMMFYQDLRVCEKKADGSYWISFEGSFRENGKEYRLQLMPYDNAAMITAHICAYDRDGYGYLDRSGNVHKIDPKFIPDSSRAFKYSFVNNKYYENGTEVTKANFGTHLFEDLAYKNVRVEIASNNFSGALQIRPTNIDISGGITLFEGADIHMLAGEGYHLRKAYYKIESNGTVTSLDIL